VAKTTVIISETQACSLAPRTIAWCAQVTDAPELSNKMVLSSGISQALKVVKKAGGQIPPSTGEGLKLEWKKAQKKPKKNIISETINKITPIFSPACTWSVCWPSKVPSRIMSLHQVNIIKRIMMKPRRHKSEPPVYPCINNTPPNVSINAEEAAIRGHGDGSTRW